MFKNRKDKVWLNWLIVMALVVSLLPTFIFATPVAAAGTATVTVTKYDAYGNIVGTPQTITFEEMESTLPVEGDGNTRYYAQGPTFINDSFDTVWNPAESINIESRDYGRPKGTDVKYLCNLAGGASPGDTVEIRSPDGFTKWFDYDDIYNPEPAQGKLVVCWYNADFGGYVDEGYTDGMRLLFFADLSLKPKTQPTDPDEYWHVFGNWNMHETLPESRWHYYAGQWPSSSGLSVKYVSNINIYEPNLISCSAAGNPKDSFAPGETVYVKGKGLTASTNYKLWIQTEPVSNNKLSIVGGIDPTLLPAYTFSAANDPSGAQEIVTTDASRNFGSTAIWTIDSSAAPLKYDIIADNQAGGTVGKYNVSTPPVVLNKDVIDSPGFEGFTVTSGPSQPAWDLNGDHACNIGDVVVIGLKWGQTGAVGWIPEDLNSDGVINIGDVVVLGLHWGEVW